MPAPEIGICMAAVEALLPAQASSAQGVAKPASLFSSHLQKSEMTLTRGDNAEDYLGNWDEKPGDSPMQQRRTMT